MFSKNEVKANLIGCFEIFLFMRKGLERFIVSPPAAVKSFLIPIAFMPVVLFITLLHGGAGVYAMWASVHVFRTVLAVGLYLLAVYFIAKQYHREQHFYKFILIFNWMNVIGIVFLLPVLGGVMAGYEMSVFRSYLVFTTLAGYVYLAFVLTHCFRLPWEMGGFVAIVGLAIDDNLHKIVETMQSVL